MLEFKEICINDKALFDKYISRSNAVISEMTFTNLFMWRKSYKFRYAILDDMLLIISVPEKSEPFSFMPLGNLSHESVKLAVMSLKDYFTEHGWVLRFERVSEDDMELLKQLEEFELGFEHNRDNCDYVYLTSDLIGLKGKKYDGKRNHINKFKKLYTFEYENIDKNNIEECYRIMDKWCSERSCSDHSDFYCENIANREMLDNYETLGCKGAIIKVDGCAEAFTVGEMLNSDTAVIHIEKANSKVNGLYTFINQQFCTNAWSNTTYINREQDLGVEGLRKAKLSYNPVKLIDKYAVIIK